MHLTDCFMELVAYVAYFQKTVAARQPSFEQVRADVLRLLAQSEAVAHVILEGRNDEGSDR